MHLGVEIEVAKSSALLDTNVIAEEKLYGYHRLDDPLVQTIQDGQISIVPQSQHTQQKEEELTSPEALDARGPVLIGRHDVPGVTYND